MRSGTLRHQITITRRNVTGQNSFGEDTLGTSTTVGAYKADVIALQGREFEAAQQKWAEARFKVRMRYTATAIRREDQITWGTRTLEILDVEDRRQGRRGDHHQVEGIAPARIAQASPVVYPILPWFDVGRKWELVVETPLETHAGAGIATVGRKNRRNVALLINQAVRGAEV